VGILLILAPAPSSAAPPITVLLANPDPNPTVDCDLGPIFVKVGRDGALTVDGTTIAEADINRHLTEMFGARVEKLIYFEADSGLPMSAALSVLARCNGIPNITIALVTSSISHSQCFVIPSRRLR